MSRQEYQAGVDLNKLIFLFIILKRVLNPQEYSKLIKIYFCIIKFDSLPLY